MNGSDFVTLRGGFTVPLEPLMLALDLEARGIQLETDRTEILAYPREKLTDADRQAIRRWRQHLIALVNYTPDDTHLYEPHPDRGRKVHGIGH